MIFRDFDDDTKKKKKKNMSILNRELPDCVQFNIHGFVNREVLNRDTTYWAPDPIIHNKVYDYAVLVMYDQ